MCPLAFCQADESCINLLRTDDNCCVRLTPSWIETQYLLVRYIYPHYLHISFLLSLHSLHFFFGLIYSLVWNVFLLVSYLLHPHDLPHYCLASTSVSIPLNLFYLCRFWIVGRRLGDYCHFIYWYIVSD